MEEIKTKKRDIRVGTQKRRDALTEEEFAEKCGRIEERLFDFANFIEAKTVLLYASFGSEVSTTRIIRRSFELKKAVLLPLVHPKKHQLLTFRIDSPETDLRRTSGRRLEPDPKRCKLVPLRYMDLAVVPGVAFDERGGRLGYGEGYYDRLIPRLPLTTRKVALTFECQMVSQVPMEPHDRYMDILITEDRIIYKI